MEAKEFRELAKNQIEEAAKLMAEVYSKDPSIEILASTKDSQRKIDFLVICFEELLSLAIRYGKVFAVEVSGELAGVGVFYPPKTYPAPRVMALISLMRLFFKIGISFGLRSFFKLLKLNLILDAHHPKVPYYYAEIGCVAERFQKHGVAAKLTEYLFSLSDQDQCGVYGETSNPENLTIWGQLGYKVRDEIQVDEMKFWSLWRDPQKKT